jgi:hypothetical protein
MCTREQLLRALQLGPSLSSARTLCATGGVKEVMRSNARGVLSCVPSETLEVG